MTKYVLLGGVIHNALDGGKSFVDEIVKDINHRPVKILDCIFARPKEDWDKRFLIDKGFLNQHLKECEIELASPEKFIDQIKKSDIIFFQGGVPHQLMNVLGRIDGWINELNGKVVVASSGGADALVKYYGVGKTGRVGEGLGLLSIKLIPHWKSNYAEDAVDWDRLFEKLKLHGEDLEIFALREGEFRVIEK